MCGREHWKESLSTFHVKFGELDSSASCVESGGSLPVVQSLEVPLPVSSVKFGDSAACCVKFGDSAAYCVEFGVSAACCVKFRDSAVCCVKFGGSCASCIEFEGSCARCIRLGDSSVCCVKFGDSCASCCCVLNPESDSVIHITSTMSSKQNKGSRIILAMWNWYTEPTIERCIISNTRIAPLHTVATKEATQKKIYQFFWLPAFSTINL